jgi:acid phosphatase family membrane protein YuiD
VQAVTTAIGMQHGFESSLFAMALCFSLIVMYDAAGVRRHAGAQAEVLNTVVKELLSMHAVSQKKLKEVLGHTPLQVFMGAILGTVCGAVYSWYSGGTAIVAMA